MNRPTLRLTEHAIDDQTAEIGVEGELDLAVADQLDRLLAGAEARWVLVDLSACEFLDSTGIAVILRADKDARRQGGGVFLHSARGQVQRILFVAGLTETYLVLADRTQALARAERGDGPVTASG